MANKDNFVDSLTRNRRQADQGGSAGQVAINITNFDSHMFGEIVEGARRVLRPSGFNTLVHSSGSSTAGERLSWDALSRANCTGTLFYTFSLSEHQMRKMLNANPHLVIMNRLVTGFESRCVYLDEALGGELAAQFLISYGHTKLAMITGPQNYHVVAQRSRGFVDEIVNNGVTIDEDLIVDGDFSFEGGASAFRSLLQNDRAFTAIFCQNDLMAAAVIDVCRVEGISVPSELSVVGFDDTKIATMTSPKLSTIRQPIAYSGSRAAEILQSLISNSEDVLDMPDDHGKMVPELVIRNSVKDLRNRDNLLAQKLTPRESECTQWIAAGKTSPEIAIILSISENTVNFHLKNVILKLKAANRTHAVALAMSKGLIERI